MVAASSSTAACYRFVTMHFDGSFDPPAIGTAVVPIEISGPGSCVVTDAGLVVRGRKSTATGGAYWLVFAAFVVGTYAVKVILWPPDWAFYLSLAVGVTLVLTFGARLRGQRKLGEETELCIPWSSVKRLARDGEKSDTVVVVVHKFKPKGGLHFTPRAGAGAFMAALREHLADD